MRLGEGRFNRPHILPSLSKREVRMGLEAFTSAAVSEQRGLCMKHIYLFAIEGAN